MNNNYQNNPTFDQAAQFCLSMIEQLNTLRKFNPSRQFYYCEQQTLGIFKHTSLYRYLGMSIFKF